MPTLGNIDFGLRYTEIVRTLNFKNKGSGGRSSRPSQAWQLRAARKNQASRRKRGHSNNSRCALKNGLRRVRSFCWRMEESHRCGEVDQGHLRRPAPSHASQSGLAKKEDCETQVNTLWYVQEYEVSEPSDEAE